MICIQSSAFQISGDSIRLTDMGGNNYPMPHLTQFAHWFLGGKSRRTLFLEGIPVLGKLSFVVFRLAWTLPCSKSQRVAGTTFSARPFVLKKRVSVSFLVILHLSSQKTTKHCTSFLQAELGENCLKHQPKLCHFVWWKSHWQERKDKDNHLSVLKLTKIENMISTYSRKRIMSFWDYHIQHLQV